MSSNSLHFSFSSFILGSLPIENNNEKAAVSKVEKTKSKEEERREKHLKEKRIARDAFEGITHLYKYGRFTSTSAHCLNRMANCLEIGFKICNNKKMYERWAFEVMPGCLRSLQKKEMKKEFKDRNRAIYFCWKTELFQMHSTSLAILINSLEKNEITRQSAKAILRELISYPGKKVEELLESYSAKENKKPASQEAIEEQVKLFLKNIDFYFLRERIENLIYRYFYQSREKKHYKTTPRIFKEIRKIVKENNVVGLIQKIVKENNVVELIQNPIEDDFINVSKNIQAASKYYQTTTEGIQNVLNECLKFNCVQPPKDIFNFNFNGCARGKINFFCQPIMEALDFKTDGETIMKTFKKLTT